MPMLTAACKTCSRSLQSHDQSREQQNFCEASPAHSPWAVRRGQMESPLNIGNFPRAFFLISACLKSVKPLDVSLIECLPSEPTSSVRP